MNLAEVVSFVWGGMSTYTFWIIVTVVVAVVAFQRAQEQNHVTWTDMIVTPGTGKLSLAKAGQLVGIIVSSWIVIVMADRNQLGGEIFGMWLAFLLGGAGWSTYLKAKNGLYGNPDRIGSTSEPSPQPEIPTSEPHVPGTDEATEAPAVTPDAKAQLKTLLSIPGSQRTENQWDMISKLLKG